MVVEILFQWLTAHVGGNWQVDKLAKQTLQHKNIDLQIPINKAETKIYIKKYCKSVWQQYWDANDKGRHLHKIKNEVGNGRIEGRNSKDETIITWLRIDHIGLNYSLNIKGRHQTGGCDDCGQLETVEQILLHCKQYKEQRNQLFQSLKSAKYSNHMLPGLLSKHSSHIYHLFIRFF